MPSVFRQFAAEAASRTAAQVAQPAPSSVKWPFSREFGRRKKGAKLVNTCIVIGRALCYFFAVTTKPPFPNFATPRSYSYGAQMKTWSSLRRHNAISSLETAQRNERDHIDEPYDLPDSTTPLAEPDESSDLEDFGASQDDDRWEVFIPDDDEYDPQPDPNDFWMDEPSE